MSGLGDAAVDDLLEGVDAVAGGGVVVVVEMHCDGCAGRRGFLLSLGVACRRYLKVDWVLSWWKKISETAVREMVVPVDYHVILMDGDGNEHVIVCIHVMNVVLFSTFGCLQFSFGKLFYLTYLCRLVIYAISMFFAWIKFRGTLYISQMAFTTVDFAFYI